MNVSGSDYIVQGKIETEYTWYIQDPILPEQPDMAASAAAEWEYIYEWNERRDSLVVTPFARIDSKDSERTHVDIRELQWTHLQGAFEFRAGIGREFWGVTEFYHLVDVINQVDLVEDLRAEDKLGQPMVAVAYQGAEQRFEFWWLPYFRERTFAADDGRFQFSSLLNIDDVIYESQDKQRHNDFALRWTTFFGGSDYGNADIGVSYFNGTARDPFFVPGQDSTTFELVPLYEQIEQWSVDVQWTIGDWLWKLEILQREGQSDDFTASTGGFEYNFVGIAGSRLDLGLVVEYMKDQRGERANHFFQDDIGLGLRLVFNDEAGSEVLFSYIQDQQNESELWRIEAERRINSNWAINAEAYLFSNIAKQDLLYGLHKDDYLQLTLSRYF